MPAGEAAEGVVAVAAGGRGGDDVAGGVEQLDGGAVDAGLAGILDAVAVAVEPDAVADGTVEPVAEVDVGAVLAGGEGEAGLVGRGDAVEVVGLGDSGGKPGDADGVAAGAEVVEGVVAVAGGRGGGDDAGAVEQLDRDAVDAGLAGVLGAVAVGVEPDPVADGSGAAIAEVDVGAVLTGGEGEGGHVGSGDAVEVVGRRDPGGRREPGPSSCRPSGC